MIDFASPGLDTGTSLTDMVRSAIVSQIVPRLEAGNLEFALSDSTVETFAVPDDAFQARGIMKPRHSHAAPELAWPVDGRCLVSIAGRQMATQSGVVCVVRPGEEHQVWPVSQGEPFQSLWWYVTARGVNLSVVGSSNRAYIARVGFVAMEPSPAPLVARVVQEFEARRPYYQLAARSLLLQLTTGVLRGLEEAGREAQAVFPGQAWSSRHVDVVAQYVDANHGAEVTLKHIAAEFGLSPHYLTALFRRYTGRSLMAHVNDVRHREALVLLRDTDLPVAEVALKVGYRDPYYFSRVFRARLGCAPQHFRHRLQPLQVRQPLPPVLPHQP